MSLSSPVGTPDRLGFARSLKPITDPLSRFSPNPSRLGGFDTMKLYEGGGNPTLDNQGNLVNSVTGYTRKFTKPGMASPFGNMPGTFFSAPFAGGKTAWPGGGDFTHSPHRDNFNPDDPFAGAPPVPIDMSHAAPPRPRANGGEVEGLINRAKKAKGKGMRYLVGEKGPEVYDPITGSPEVVGLNGPEVRTFPKDGEIIPNHKLPKGLTGKAAQAMDGVIPLADGGANLGATSTDFFNRQGANRKLAAIQRDTQLDPRGNPIFGGPVDDMGLRILPHSWDDPALSPAARFAAGVSAVNEAKNMPKPESDVVSGGGVNFLDGKYGTGFSGEASALKKLGLGPIKGDTGEGGTMFGPYFDRNAVDSQMQRAGNVATGGHLQNLADDAAADAFFSMPKATVLGRSDWNQDKQGLINTIRDQVKLGALTTPQAQSMMASLQSGMSPEEVSKSGSAFMSRPEQGRSVAEMMDPAASNPVMDAGAGPGILTSLKSLINSAKPSSKAGGNQNILESIIRHTIAPAASKESRLGTLADSESKRLAFELGHTTYPWLYQYMFGAPGESEKLVGEAAGDTGDQSLPPMRPYSSEFLEAKRRTQAARDSFKRRNQPIVQQ